MATIAELLASSLNALKQVQRGEDFTIIKSSDLSRTHIKRLVDNHFLKPIIKGWYVDSNNCRMESCLAHCWFLRSLYSSRMSGLPILLFPHKLHPD